MKTKFANAITAACIASFCALALSQTPKTIDKNEIKYFYCIDNDNSFDFPLLPSESTRTNDCKNKPTEHCERHMYYMSQLEPDGGSYKYSKTEEGPDKKAAWRSQESVEISRSTGDFWFTRNDYSDNGKLLSRVKSSGKCELMTEKLKF